MKFKIGDFAIIQKSFSAEDVKIFAQVSGDYNPIHLDEDYAKTTLFKTRIVHGALVTSLFSTILGTTLPGEGTIYLSQESKFLRPVFLDEIITAKVTIIEIMADKKRIILLTEAYNPKEEKVVTGQAIVMVPNI